MVVDISEHKKTVESLKETTDLLQSIMNSATEVIIAATDPAGNILSWNEGARKILGYEPEEVIGKKNIRIFHTKNFIKSGKIEEVIKNMASTHKPKITELDYVTKAGKIFPVHQIVTPRFSDNGKFTGMLGMSTDISERKQAEEKMIQCKIITDNIKEALILFNNDGIVSFVNPEYEKITGYKNSEIAGKSGIEIAKVTIRPDDVKYIIEAFKRTLNEEKLEPITTVMINKNGAETLVNFTTSFVKDEKGKPVQIFAAIRDITDKINAEKEIEKLKQMLLKSQMNPHFVFNSLIAIQSFIHKKKPIEASKYLSSFAKLIRYILNSSTEDYVPIEKEIQAINHYLELQKLRFDNKFDYSVYIDPEINIEMISIPPMLVQPFIENAIEHGIQHKKTKGNIDIRFVLKDNTIFFKVEDDGIGRAKAGKLNKNKDEIHKPFGTSITIKRIENLNKSLSQKIKLNVIDLKDNKGNITGTKVTLNIPFK